MAFFEELGKKIKDVAAVTAEKTKDVAAAASEAAKEAAELAKINVAIAGEQREIEKNYRTIGEWFATEFDGEIPEAVKPLFEAVAASKQKIVELEASKPVKEEAPAPEEAPAEEAPAEEPAPAPAAAAKKCPICGVESDSRFCPQCGAPMGD